MGEAKRRGTFEERKQQAINEGRCKKQKENEEFIKRVYNSEYKLVKDDFGNEIYQYILR